MWDKMLRFLHTAALKLLSKLLVHPPKCRCLFKHKTNQSSSIVNNAVLFVLCQLTGLWESLPPAVSILTTVQRKTTHLSKAALAQHFEYREVRQSHAFLERIKVGPVWTVGKFWRSSHSRRITDYVIIIYTNKQNPFGQLPFVSESTHVLKRWLISYINTSNYNLHINESGNEGYALHERFSLFLSLKSSNKLKCPEQENSTKSKGGRVHDKANIHHKNCKSILILKFAHSQSTKWMHKIATHLLK